MPTYPLQPGWSGTSCKTLSKCLLHISIFVPAIFLMLAGRVLNSCGPLIFRQCSLYPWHLYTSLILFCISFCTFRSTMLLFYCVNLGPGPPVTSMYILFNTFLVPFPILDMKTLQWVIIQVKQVVIRHNEVPKKSNNKICQQEYN